MRRSKKLLLVCSLILGEIVIALTSFARPVAAAKASYGTHVGGSLPAYSEWTAEGSPYLVDSQINLPATSTLIIGPGAKVRMADGIYNADMRIYGTLRIEGSPDNRVDIATVPIFMMLGNVDVSYADLHDGSGIITYKGSASVASTTIKNRNGAALSVQGGILRGTNIRIENATTGIFALPTYRGLFTPDVQPDVVIRGSSFIGTELAANNWSSAVLDLRENWWGTSAGPAENGPNGYKGPTSYSPWLMNDPQMSCCSSVLFIPGLEGSRLYLDSNTLWEPNTNLDVRKLYLDKTGSSTLLGVYSGEPIDKALGIKSIYGSFLRFLNGLEKSGTVNEASAYGYDWRRPIETVAGDSERKATTTKNLLAEISDLAGSSRTGKVTIVAHSNGGLIARDLVKLLSEQGKSHLIDKVISVASPFLGTTEAIAALLHGDDQSILGGFILSKAVARGLGENMPSVYSLLPSAGFFKKIFTPTVAFASTSLKSLNDGSYPQRISTAYDQDDFIRDTAGARPVPRFDDVASPLVGNADLMSRAESIHDMLDRMAWPNEIANIALVGTNRLTPSTVNYSSRSFCSMSFLRLCDAEIGHFASTTANGDGTVLAQSASLEDDNTIYLDLGRISRNEGSSYDHVNILESTTTQAVIRGLLYSKTPTAADGVGRSQAGEANSIVLSTHSPVDMHVYDASGAHTGIVSSAFSDDSYVAARYEEKIPGSSFRTSDHADGTYETYITVPEEGGPYRVEIEGNGFGFFTYETEKVRGPESLEHQVYMTEPVTPLSTASTVVSKESISDPMSLDIEGDGVKDATVTTGGTGLPGNAGSLEEAEKIAGELAAATMAKTVEELLQDDPHKQGILQRIEHIKQLSQAGKLKQSAKQEQSFMKRLGHFEPKHMAQTDRKKLIEAIEDMLDAE